MRRLVAALSASPASAAAALWAASAQPRLYSTTPIAMQLSPVHPTAPPGDGHLRSTKPHAQGLQQLVAYTHSFADIEGRRPRVLLCTFDMCPDGRPDDGFAIVLADLGFDVDIGPRKQSPANIVRQAIEADVHGIHVTVLSDTGAASLPCLLECLRQERADDIFVTVATDSSLHKLVPAGAVFVKRGDLSGAAETMVRLLQKAGQPVDC